MGQGLTNQIENSVPGMDGRGLQPASGARLPRLPLLGTGPGGRGNAVVAGRGGAQRPSGGGRGPDDHLPLAEIDVVIDVTGLVEFGTQVILEAFAHRKPVVLMNAEVDATIGPILRVYGKKHGAILSACDGDEPGLQMNLVRWVQGLGSRHGRWSTSRGCRMPTATPPPRRAGPSAGAERGDGHLVRRRLKISFEQTIVANATGFKVLSRGMSRGRKYDGLDHGRRPALRRGAAWPSGAWSTTRWGRR